MKKLFLIDGNAIIHRAFHALPNFTTSKGELINAVYGFSSMLLNIINSQKPEYIAVSFDRAAKTFRHEEYKDYKATRVKAPDELYAQIPRVKQVVEAFNIPIYEIDGFEADDVLGTLAKQAAALPPEAPSFEATATSPEAPTPSTEATKPSPELHTYIVTGDMDTLQLVTDRTSIFAPHKGFQESIIYTPTNVLAKYGLTPSQIVDYKALKGDPSDNIPGVYGVGDKTAVQLLQKYKTLDGIYEHLEEIPGALHDKLAKDHDKAYMSRHLAAIVTDVPVKLDIDNCKTHEFNKEKLAALFKELEFTSLLAKLQKFNDHYGTRAAEEHSQAQQKLF